MTQLGSTQLTTTAKLWEMQCEATYSNILHFVSSSKPSQNTLYPFKLNSLTYNWVDRYRVAKPT